MKKALFTLLCCLHLSFAGNASVVVTDIVPDSTKIISGAVMKWFAIDIDNNGTEDYNFNWSFSPFGSKSVSCFGPASSEISVTGTVAVSDEMAVVHDSAVLIDGSLNWGDAGFQPTIHSPTAPGFADSGDRFIGVRFTTGTGVHYGWILVNFSLSTKKIAVLSYAYETVPGKGIYTPSPTLITDFTASTTFTDTTTDVSFSDLTTEAPTSWQWTFTPSTVSYKGGTNATSQYPVVQFNADGLYTVKLKITTATLTDSVTKTSYITVNSSPRIFFTASTTSPDTKTTVTFTDMSTNKPTSWNWTFTPATVTYMAGTGPTSQHPQVRFDLDGPYTVKLKASNGAGSDSLTKTDYVNAVAAVPVADFTASTVSTDTKTTVTFTDRSLNLPYGWEWTFTPATVTYMAGTGPTSQNPQVQFNTGGTYTVKLKAINSAGSDSLTKADYITISAAPLADFTASTVKTDTKTTVSFTDKSANVPDSWEWTFVPATITYMGGTGFMSQNPQVLFNAPGKYQVSLKASNITGSNSVTKTDYITIEIPTGISYYGVGGNLVKVYPNPASKVLTVECPSAEGTIRLLDMTGKTELLQSIKAKKTELDVSRLPKGYHMLHIDNPNGTANQKLLIE